MTALPKGEPRACAPLYRRIPRWREAVRPYNRLSYLRLILALSFRVSDRRHWRGNPSPAPAGAESLSPSVREVARSAGWRDVDPLHPRCSSVGGDAHIAPHTAPAVSFRASAHTGVGIRSPRPQARNLQSLPCVKGGVARRATEELLSPGGAEPRPYTRLPIAFAPSVRADVGIRPYEITGGVCVIRTGGQSPRAPTTAYRQQKHFPKQRPLAATYLCRFAAKARFDNRLPPRRVFPKREGRSPPSLVVSRGKDF